MDREGDVKGKRENIGGKRGGIGAVGLLNSVFVMGWVVGEGGGMQPL